MIDRETVILTSALVVDINDSKDLVDKFFEFQIDNGIFPMGGTSHSGHTYFYGVFHREYITTIERWFRLMQS